MYSTKPYYIRAVYEWCTDCGYTPFIKAQVDTDTDVPLEYVKDGEIVLNIGPIAAHNVVIENDMIRLSARFNGVSRGIRIPTQAVMAIFSRETGQGLIFSDNDIVETSMVDLPSFELGAVESTPSTDNESPTPDNDPPKSKKPELRIVK